MKSKILKRLLSYSSVAALLPIAGDVNASLVVKDISPDITLKMGDGFLLDMNNDGIVDFDFRMTYYTRSGEDGYPWAAVWPISNGVVGYFSSTLQYGYVLSSGSSVTSGMEFLNGNSNSYQIYSVGLFYLIGDSTVGDWVDDTEKYLGVRFDIKGSDHYGWVMLSSSISDTSYTIHGYGYDDDPSVKSVPLDVLISADITLTNDAKIYSFGQEVIISNAEGEVFISDISGRMVHRSNLVNGTNSISLSNGLYIVRVGSVSKKVYIGN